MRLIIPAIRQYLRDGNKVARPTLRKCNDALWSVGIAIDFNRLRSESEPHLVEGKKVKFILHLKEGKPAYEMQVT